MNILGLNLGHDSSCTLIKKSKIVAACEQERYSKKKHTREFPLEAIKDALKIGKISINKVDLICVAFLPLRYLDEFFIKQFLKDKRNINFILDGEERIKENLNLETIIRKKLGFKKKIIYKSHHLCHLASAYYPSNFKKSLIFSCDGIGEIDTTLFGIGLNKKIKLLNSNSKFPDSLGLIYAAFTFFLGWKPFYDEGIIMGLSPYGDANKKISNINKSYIELMRDIIQYKDGSKFIINKKWISYHYQRNTWFSKHFFKIFGKPRKYNSKIESHHKNIAAALQKRLEEVVIKILKYQKKKYHVNHLCIAGGVGLNCSLNGAIVKAKIFKEIFVKPASGDSGTSYGAAILGAEKKINKIDFSKPTFYLGSRYTNKEIIKDLSKFKKQISYKKYKKIEQTVAKLLSQKK